MDAGGERLPVEPLSPGLPRAHDDLAVEGQALGPRMSADVTDDDDGLRRLPAQGTLNLRLSRALLAGASLAEVFVRVANVLDARVDTQTGLVEAGRTLVVGVNAWHDGGS